MMKRFFCILLSLMLLAAGPFALAEDAAADTAEAAEPAEAPVLLSVNSDSWLYHEPKCLITQHLSFLSEYY